MTILDAIILGLVEGITEYLPVSSTGHLILTSWLLGLSEDPAQKQSIDSFNIIIQGGAILAVLGLYWKRVQSMVKGLAGRDPAGRALFIKLVLAFLPAAILGVLFDDVIEERLFRPIPVLIALGGGGVEVADAADGADCVVDCTASVAAKMNTGPFMSNLRLKLERAAPSACVMAAGFQEAAARARRGRGIGRAAPLSKPLLARATLW